MRKKYILRGVAVVVMAALMVMSFAGCGGFSEKDIQALVQGNLDVIYLDKINPGYPELVSETEESLHQTYEDGLAVEAETFAYYFSIEYPTDEINEQIIDLYRNIYSHSKYTVETASKVDSENYAVSVSVSPINIFELVNEDFDSYMASLNEKYANVDFDSMTDEEYQAYDSEWAQTIINLCNEKLADIDYDTPISLTLHVTLGSDGYWVIDDDDFGNIDLVMITYP